MPLKTLIYTTYLWTLNEKPFNSKQIRVLKRRILESFLREETPSGRYFQKYGEQIVEGLGWPFSSDEDQQRIWHLLPELASRELAWDLPKVEKWSFAQTPEFSKLSSWYSWNRSAKSQIPEFIATKMLYEFHLKGSVADPDDDPTDFTDLKEAGKVKDPKKQLQAMRAATGGIALAYKLMNSQLLEMAKVMYCCTMAVWKAYGERTKKCKTPYHRLQYLLVRRQQQSRREQTLVEIVQCSLLRADVLNYVGIGVGGGKLHSWMLDICLHLVSQKWWSDQVRLNSPPEVYVEVLGANTARQDATVQTMRRTWEVWMNLENLRFHRPDIRFSLQDLDGSASNRIMYMMFERGKFSPTYMPARKVLRGQVDVFPDNKLVEDLHLEPKLDSKAKHNRKQRAARIQDKVMNTNALSSREMEDTARINKEIFVAGYKYASKRYCQARHNSSKHLLKKSWSKILGKKTWGTV